MSDDLAEEKKASEAPNKTINQAKKNVKRVNWEKTEDTKKSNSQLRENNNKSKNGSQEAPRQQQLWRPKTNNSTLQPTNCEVPKEKKKEQEEAKGYQQTQRGKMVQ